MNAFLCTFRTLNFIFLEKYLSLNPIFNQGLSKWDHDVVQFGFAKNQNNGSLLAFLRVVVLVLQF